MIIKYEYYIKILIDDNLAEQANEYYQSVLNSMNQGDWTGIGENLDKLGNVLEALK